MSTADEYRRLAAEARELAENLLPDFRGILLAIAQQWTNLAEEADRPAGDIAPDPPPPEEE